MLYNEILWRFQIFSGATSTGDLITLILVIKLYVSVVIQVMWSYIKVFNLEIGYK